MDDTPPPTLDPASYDRISAALASGGAEAAIDKLCSELREAEDFQALFYALLMKKRLSLGVSPFPNSPASELPAEAHEPYENAIREAGRLVGNLYLERRELFKAWGFFRMLGEPETMRAALENYVPGEDEDTYGLVDIAWQQGLYPQKGFDIILDRHGICSAITMVGSADLSRNPEIRDYCVKRLVRSLHDQLRERITSDLDSRGESVTPYSTLAELLRNYPDLVTEDLYHIDVSHLSSVVQMATQLPPCEELDLACELCDYGAKLSHNIRGEMPAPFEGGYADYKVYLEILAGKNIEEGIQHFRSKLDDQTANGETYAAESLVNLLLRIDRLPEALEVSKAYLANAQGELSCPSVTELARRAKDFATLAEVAKSNADPVSWLAGLIAKG